MPGPALLEPALLLAVDKANSSSSGLSPEPVLVVADTKTSFGNRLSPNLLWWWPTTKASPATATANPANPSRSILPTNCVAGESCFSKSGHVYPPTDSNGSNGSFSQRSVLPGGPRSTRQPFIGVRENERAGKKRKQPLPPHAVGLNGLLKEHTAASNALSWKGRSSVLTFQVWLNFQL